MQENKYLKITLKGNEQFLYFYCAHYKRNIIIRENMGSLSKGVLSLITIFVFTSTADAQIMNRIKKRAQDRVVQKVEEKIENKINQTADRMVDNTWNSIFGENPEKTGNSGSRTFPFKLNSDVTTESEYSFDIVSTMEIISTDEKGKTSDPMIMKMHFNENDSYTGTAFISEESRNNEAGEVFLVYDFKNEAMVMLMNSEDGKFSFAYDWLQAAETETVDDLEKDTENLDTNSDAYVGYERIGNRTILGYECEGYRLVEENSVMEVWVTNDENFGFENVFNANSNSKQLRGNVSDNYPKGMILELNNKNKSNSESMTMRMTNIQKNANINYLMSEYPNLAMGNN